MTNQELTALYEQRIPHIYPLIRFRARGDEDLEQIGRIRVYEELKKKPDAKDNWLKNSAKWAMNDERKRGHSVDKPRLRRKYEYQVSTLIDEHDQALDVFPMARQPNPETLTIDKITMERFMDSLTGKEAIYTSLKVDDEWPDEMIQQHNGWTRDGIRQMKRNIRAKLEKAFAC